MPEAPGGGQAPLPLRFPDSGGALQIRNGKMKKETAPWLRFSKSDPIILWIIFGHFGAVQVWIMLKHVWLRSTFTKETQVTSFFAIGQKKLISRMADFTMQSIFSLKRGA